MSLKIALITDMHFGRPALFNGQLRKLGHAAEPLTRRFVEHMTEAVQPDLVVNLGDVIEDEDDAADRRHYGQFLDVFSGLRAPALHVAGNHDTVHLSDGYLADRWGRPGPLFYSLDLGPWHLVVLRTVETPGRRVDLPKDQLEFLEHDLARAKAPVVVFMHHPVSEMVLRGNRWFEKAPHICRVSNRRAVRQVLEASGKVVAVFNGHCHWNHFEARAQIPYFTLQSLTENVDEDAPGRPAATWALATLDERSVHVEVFGEQPARYQVAGGSLPAA